MFVRRRDAKKRAERRRKQERKRKLRTARRKRKEDEKIQEYWDKVWDMDDVRDGRDGRVRVFKHKPGQNDPLLPTLCAKIGLHWYNLRHKTNWQFQHIERYTKIRGGIKYCDYYITLVAKDSACFPLFQTSVCHRKSHQMDVTWCIFRPRSPPGHEVTPTVPCEAYPDGIYPPEWPSTFDGNKKCSLLDESQLVANDWILSYLDLALFTTNRSIGNSKLSGLKITMAAVETEENVEHSIEILNCPGNAVFYIMYEHPDYTTCKAIVRRTVDLASGSFHLSGRTLL